MHRAATERLEFAPPPDKRSLGALALALFVHLLLIAALTWGVNWKHTEEAASFEAELWSAGAQQAAPHPTPPQAVAEPEKHPEPTPPTPIPVPRPAPAPIPPLHPVKTPQAKPAPPAHEADIALEKEKKRQQLAQKAAEQKQAKKLRENQRAELQAQHKAAEKVAEQKRQAKAQEQERVATKNRREVAVKHIMNMAADGSGSTAKGSSAGYGGKVRAKVLPNVVFTDEITGNPEAEVEVRTTADGTIMSQRVINSSGNQAWNDAVIKALIRTGSLPRDVDGRVPTPMIITFRPN